MKFKLFFETENNILNYINNIKNILRKYSFSELADPYLLKNIFNSIKYEIYRFMTERGDKYKNLSSLFNEGDNRKYIAMLNSIYKPLSNYVGANIAGWIAFYFKDIPRVKKDYIEDYSITYKEYFTIKFNSLNKEGVLKEIESFINFLPNILVSLHVLCLRTNDFIQIKVPSNISTFISHSDTLVCHFYKESNRNTIKQIFGTLSNYLEKRNYRTTSGFDFKKNEEGGSHSILISKLIASEILLNYEKILNSTENTLANIILNRIEFYNNITPQEVHSKLGEIQGRLSGKFIK